MIYALFFGKSFWFWNLPFGKGFQVKTPFTKSKYTEGSVPSKEIRYFKLKRLKKQLAWSFTILQLRSYVCLFALLTLVFSKGITLHKTWCLWFSNHVIVMVIETKQIQILKEKKQGFLNMPGHCLFKLEKNVIDILSYK